MCCNDPLAPPCHCLLGSVCQDSRLPYHHNRAKETFLASYDDSLGLTDALTCRFQIGAQAISVKIDWHGRFEGEST